MFVIVHDIIREAPEHANNFDCFDIMTNPVGFPMKFETVKDALKFLNLMGIDNEVMANSEGEIRIDRLH